MQIIIFYTIKTPTNLYAYLQRFYRIHEIVFHLLLFFLNSINIDALIMS